MKALIHWTTLALFLLLPAFAIADECTDTCQATHTATIQVCNAELDEALGQCESSYLGDLDECDQDFSDCQSQCGGDEECEIACQAAYAECMGNAENLLGSCLNNAHDSHYSCVEQADAELEDCLGNCTVSVEILSWGAIKARYQ